MSLQPQGCIIYKYAASALKLLDYLTAYISYFPFSSFPWIPLISTVFLLLQEIMAKTAGNETPIAKKSKQHT